MQLLEHFHELSLHPNNAKELKDLILQLAIQGKLTKKWRKENPSQEHASVLLKRIKDEKEQLIREKKIRKEKLLPALSEVKIPYDLPEGWVWTKLGLISSIVGGGTPKSGNPEYFSDNGVPWFTPADLGKYKSKFVDRGRRDISALGLQKSSAQLMPAGSVMFSSRAPIGHTAIGLFDFCTNQGFKSAVPFLLEMNEYIYYYFNSIVKAVNDNASGTTFKEVSGIIVKNFLIPLPPLKEQKAIVSIVEQLFKEVEQLEQLTVQRIQLKEDFATSALKNLTSGDTQEEWAKLQAHFHTFFNESPNIKKLRETILQLAVQGKLTAHWRKTQTEPVEDAQVLLDKIKAEKDRLVSEKKIKKEKPLPAITKGDIPYELPEGWVWCRFQDVIKDLRYGTSKKCDFGSGNNPVLRIPNILDGKIDLKYLKSTTLTDKECRDLSLNKGDILLIRSNGSVKLVGRSAPIDEIGIGYSFAGYLVRARVFFKSVATEYLHIVLESPFIRKSIENPIRTTSGVKNINSTEISQLLVGLPNTNEQKAIVEKVNHLLGMCDQLEKEVQLSKTQTEQLMKSVLREVFENHTTT